MQTARGVRIVGAGVAAAGLLAAGGLVPAGTASVAAPAAPAAQTEVIKVCVKKKTGEMRLKKKGKKCRKGWKKMVWNSQGPQGAPGAPGADGAPGSPGAAGPPGPQQAVVDSGGVELGRFAGFYDAGEDPKVFVRRDGGLWLYYLNGTLSVFGDVTYTTPTCIGDAFLRASDDELPYYMATVGGLGRAVARSLYPKGQARAYALSNIIAPTAGTTLYALDRDGACNVEVAAYVGNLARWTPVEAPPDGAGPLRVE